MMKGGSPLRRSFMIQPGVRPPKAVRLTEREALSESRPITPVTVHLSPNEPEAQSKFILVFRPSTGSRYACVRLSLAIAIMRWLDREADASTLCSPAQAVASCSSASAFAIERVGRGLIGAWPTERTPALPTRVHRYPRRGGTR